MMATLSTPTDKESGLESVNEMTTASILAELDASIAPQGQARTPRFSSRVTPVDSTQEAPPVTPDASTVAEKYIATGTTKAN